MPEDEGFSVTGLGAWVQGVYASSCWDHGIGSVRLSFEEKGQQTCIRLHKPGYAASCVLCEGDVSKSAVTCNGIFASPQFWRHSCKSLQVSGLSVHARVDASDRHARVCVKLIPGMC